MSEAAQHSLGGSDPVGPSTSRASLDRVLSAAARQGLRVKTPRGNEAFISCPLHEDKSPSLHLTWKSSGGDGVTLIYCQSCQAPFVDLVEGLGLTPGDLYDEPRSRVETRDRVGRSPQQRRAAKRRGKLGRLPARIAAAPPAEEPEHQWVETERYDYADVQGTVVQEVIRSECRCDGTTHKSFTQRFITPTGARVKRKPAGFVPVLYRAPEVHAARLNGQTIWLLEGEKDVHTAEALGLVATTNTQGGKSFPDELVDELAGAHVVVVLDRDATGWDRGVDLHRKLSEAGCRVDLLLPALDEPKADFTDHVEAGHQLVDLLQVTVDEVATWAALTPALAKQRRVAADVDEVTAHLQRSEVDTAELEHRRLAKRWAAEVEIQFESLRECVRAVHVAGLRAGTSWAGDALVEADTVLRACAEDSLHALDLAGVPVSQHIRDAVPSRAEAETPAEMPTETAPGADGWFGGGGVAAVSPTFRISGGQIVQWEPNTRQRGEDEADGKYKALLSTVVKLTAREYLETEDEEDVDEADLLGREASVERAPVRSPRKLAAVRVAYRDPVSGEVMEMRVSADAWRDHSWLESLPGQPDYDHKRAGLEQLQRAIIAVSDKCIDTTIYRSTGWRQRPDGSWLFVHRRGAIDSTGHVDAQTYFEGAIDRFDLPDPCTDPGRLRAAFLEHSATMLDRLPTRVAAPLLGATFRAALGHNPWVMTLVGPPGSYKTSIAAKVMHHWGERWSHSKAASSMSGNGDTFNVLRYKLHHAKDALMWLDDFAPTKSWIEAQRNLEETARLVHNQEARGRLQREGLGVNPGTPPRASALCTSEVMPRPGSGGERMLVIPLAAKDVQTEALFPLDDTLSRHGRALVGASFIQWLAADVASRRRSYRAAEDAFADELTKHHDESVRQAAALASTWSGWVAMVDFLQERGALSDSECDQLLTRVRKALIEAGQQAVDPDLPRRTGARVRELLQYALGQGIAYLDDVRTGECPPWPLARRLGWRRTILDVDHDGKPHKIRMDRGSQSLGWVLHDPGPRDRGRVLICESTQLEAVLKAASATQTEQLQIDRNTAMRALYDEGVLLGEEEKNGKLRFTTKCRIHCEGRDARRVVLWLDKILGDDDSGDDGDVGAITEPPGRPDLPVAPAEVADPQVMDAPEASLLPSTELTEEGLAMAAESTDWPDAEGVIGWTQPGRDDPGPCITCGGSCSFWISDVRIHLTCWRSSTAASRGTARTKPAESPALGAAASPVTAPPPATTSVTAAPPPAMTSVGGEFRALAAVIDVDGIWLSNGEHLELPQVPTHLGELHDLAQQLRLGMRSTKYLSESGQVWIADGLAAHIGIDVAAIREQRDTGRDLDSKIRSLTQELEVVTSAVDAGYRIGGDGQSMRPWTRVWKDKAKSTWVVLIAALPLDPRVFPLGADEPAPATLARRIGLLANAMGFPFYMGSSTTGTDLMKQLRYKDRDRFFAVREPIAPAMLNIEPELEWSRLPTDEERQHKYVHCYDRSGSFLAGVAGLELGYGEPRHHPDGAAFTPRKPGYWRIEIPDSGDWRAPNPLDPRGSAAGRTLWVTTPTIEVALEQGYEPQILEAYTWPNHARILDPWYERLRDARERLDVQDADAQVARSQLKGVYAAAVGMVGSKRFRAGREGYAPDWRHHIVAKARANVLRRINQIGNETGRWPIAVVTDSVIYTSPIADPDQAWPGRPDQLGRALGKYKHEGVGLLEDQLKFLGGKGYAGRQLIVDDDAPGSE